MQRRVGRGGDGIQKLEESRVRAFLRNETSFGLGEPLTLKLFERFQ